MSTNVSNSYSSFANNNMFSLNINSNQLLGNDRSYADKVKRCVDGLGHDREPENTASRTVAYWRRAPATGPSLPCRWRVFGRLHAIAYPSSWEVFSWIPYSIGDGMGGGNKQRDLVFQFEELINSGCPSWGDSVETSRKAGCHPCWWLGLPAGGECTTQRIRL